MARVLVIEDETTLRLSVARGLGRLPGVAVDAAGSMAEAVAAIDQAPPDLVLSDIDLPDRSGLEVLGELGRRGLRRPVIFVSAYLRAYGAQIPPHADVEVLEKPASLSALREAVTRRLRRAPDSSEPAPFAAADLLQLACMGRRSVVIDVLSPAGRGRLVVRDGVAWSASDSFGQGEAAFRRLAFRRDGPVECHALHDGPPGERDLLKSWENLVLEAAQAIDEASRDAQADGAPAAGPGAPGALAPGHDAAHDELGDDFDACWEQGVQALLARHHLDALRAFQRAHELRPSDRRAAANLDRLHALGYHLEPPSPPSSPSPTPAPLARRDAGSDRHDDLAAVDPRALSAHGAGAGAVAEGPEDAQDRARGEVEVTLDDSLAGL